MSGAQEALVGAISAHRAIAGKYKTWVRKHADIVGLRHDPVERECVLMETELGRLERAAQRRMCVGVFGASQAGKSYLISSLASKPGEQLLAKAGDRTLKFIGDINPAVSGKETTGVVTRFTSTETLDDPNYPIELSLLSEMDIAKILSNSYFSDFETDALKRVSGDEIEATLGEVALAVDAARSDRAYDLSAYLERQLHPDVYRANFAQFKPHWGRISEILEHGAVADRVRAYSLFWGCNSYFTEVFEKMISALEELGHADRCWATPEVFDPQANVILVSALQQIWNGSGLEANIRTNSGEIRKVDHATLSALVTELKVVIKEPPADFFGTTDLLDFPGARTRSEEKAIDETVVGKALVRGKVAYLFDRYLDNRELTAMLLCVGDGPQEVGPLAGMIERWITVTHGKTPQARADQPCALFFVATKADLTFNIASRDAVNMLEDRMHSMLERFGGARSGDEAETGAASMSWVREWQPGSQFRNMYWLRNTSQPSTGILSRGEKNTPEFEETGFDTHHTEVFKALREAVTTSAKVSQHFREPDRAWNEMLELNDGGRTYLISNLQSVCHEGFKRDQLQREFAEFQQRLERLLREFHADGDAERVFKERSRAVRAALQDVRACALQQKFGEFLLMCYMSERSLKGILRQLEREDPDTGPAVVRKEDDGWDAIFDDDDEDIAEDEAPEMPKERHDVFADRVLSTWSDQLQAVLENPRVSRYLNISPENLETMFNEMREGAQRAGLADKVAQTSRDASQFPRSSERLIPHKARMASLTVNHFVNQLGYEAGELTLKDKARTPLFDRPVTPDGGVPDLPRTAEPRAVKMAQHWAWAFKNLSESNARTDDGLSGVDLAANAELGGLIQAMTDSKA
jgi:hypothetical protein